MFIRFTNYLGCHRSGRVAIHLIIMCRTGHFRNHLAGIRREFPKEQQ